MVFRLFRIEVRKIVRRRDLYVSVALVAIFVAAFFYGFARQNWDAWFRGHKGAVYRALEQYSRIVLHRPFNLSEYTNGIYFTGMAVGFSFHLLIPIVASLIGGILVAGEAKDGTLRAVLIRPVSRSQLLLAKFGVAIVYLVLVMAFYVGSCLALGVPTFGWNHILAFNNAFMQVGEGRGAFFVMEPSEAIRRLGLVCALGGYAMLVVASLALFLSTLFDSPIVPIVGAVGLYFISLILGTEAEGFFEEIRKYLFTSHMFFWRNLFAKEIPWGDVGRDLLWCTGYTAGFLLLALVAFRVRDVKS